LKISVTDAPGVQRLLLEGRLTAENLSELAAAWESARAARGSRQCIVDLSNATFVDPSAEATLLEMKRDGASFIAPGVCTSHQLAQLGILCE
jgi:anti-anti-sigma regulatory factor